MIIINSNTRQFNIPGADLVFGVVADSDAERKYFQCPRYVGDNLDLAACFIRINYRNANGKTDFYLVDDMAINGDNITFSWLLSPRVTEYRGQVKFVMCAVGPDLKLKWHTAQGTGQVMEGLEPDNSHVESQTADVVAQLISMVEAQTTAVENTGAEQAASVRSAAEIAKTAAVNEIEAKRANSVASIPKDYTTLSGTVESLVRGRGGAIVCEAEGTAVSVDDASDMAIQGMRIFGKSTQDGTPTPDAPVEIVSVEKPVVTLSGKNLIPQLSAYNGHGITITENDDGSSTINGTTTNALGYKSDSVFLPAGTYTLKCKRPLGESTWLSISNTPLMLFPGDYHKTFTLESGEHWLYLYANAGVKFDNYVLEAQLEFGDNNTEFEPYHGQTIATANALRGIPVTSGGNYTDENGQQWICDEVDLERGVYVQRLSSVELTGDEGWGVYRFEPTYYGFSAPNILDEVCTRNPGVCNQFVHLGQRDDNCVWVGVANMSVYVISREWFDKGVDAWVEHLRQNPLRIVYARNSTVETPLSEMEIAAYRTLHSNYPNTTVLNNAGAHMEVKYAADTKLYIDKKIKEALQ